MQSDLVSCLMVTANRPELVARAIYLFERQTYPQRELLIVDDGDCDLSQIIDSSPDRHLIRYVRISREPRRTLGDLRNVSIANAQGMWCIQWDDDEWYHPSRIQSQLEVASLSRTGASVLKWTLMHVNEPSQQIGQQLFRTDVGIGTPGTILFRRDLAPMYPHLSRNEDGVFMRMMRDNSGLAVMGPEFSHLFVRIFHGSNTWEREHFLRRLRRRPSDWPSWMYANFMRKDLTAHRAFRLSSIEKETAHDYFDYLLTATAESVS